MLKVAFLPHECVCHGPDPVGFLIYIFLFFFLGQKPMPLNDDQPDCCCSTCQLLNMKTLLCSLTHCVVLHISWGVLTGIDWAVEHERAVTTAGEGNTDESLTWFSSQYRIVLLVATCWLHLYCGGRITLHPSLSSLLSHFRCSSTQRCSGIGWSRFISKHLAVLLKSIRTWSGNSPGRLEIQSFILS